MSTDPLVIDDWLEPGEARVLREVAELGMERSTTEEDGRPAVARTSSSASVPKWAVPRLVARAARLTGCPVATFESVHVTRYLSGELYGPHLDAPDCVPADWVGGNRVATVIVYLNDVEVGGGTSFPLVGGGTTVVPRAGRAVMFRPTGPDRVPDPRLVHEALPPLGCEKWVAQLWARERATDHE